MATRPAIERAADRGNLDVRSDIIRRLRDSSARWRGIGQLRLKQGDEGGHDSIRMSRRIAAIVNVLRAPDYREVVDDAFLKRHANQPAGVLAGLIQDHLPGKKIPGYIESA